MSQASAAAAELFTFDCSHCASRLQATVVAAGRLARCPKCRAVTPIPAADDEPSRRAGRGFVKQNDSAALRQKTTDEETGPDTGLPQSVVSRIFGYVPPAVPMPVTADDIMRRSWDIYYHHLGRLILVALLVMTGIAAASLVGFSLTALIFWLVLKYTTLELAILVGCVTLFPAMLPATWILAGLFVYLTKLARGHRAEWRDLLRGGPASVNFLKTAIAIGLLTLAGMLLCVVPGLLVMALFLPAVLLVVERDVRPGDAMKAARQLARGNLLQLSLIAAVHLGVESLSHLIPCGLGYLFTLPFVALLWVVTYLRLTGQPTVQYECHAN